MDSKKRKAKKGFKQIKAQITCYYPVGT